MKVMRELGAPAQLVSRLWVSPLLPQRQQAVGIQPETLPQCQFMSTDKDARASYRRQYISLYNYTPLDKEKLPRLRRDLREQWGELGVVGRIYIAEEGINGQLVVPEPAIAAFERSFPRLLQDAKLFYGHLIEDKAERNETEEGTKSAGPFHKLDVRVRGQILQDGFQGGELCLQDAGHSLSPEQWHHKLKTRNDTQDSDTLVLDVRNFYEHEIGRFDGATRIMVDTFRDTFEALDEILEKHEKEHEGQKPKEVMMYCTGGIRCEKVGAYLTQYKGISNVQKLHGGIVNYMRFLKEQRQAAARAHTHSVSVDDVAKSGDEDVQEVTSLFKGKNFVFDQRCVSDLTESEEVTDDVLGQCSKCARNMRGACCVACKVELVKTKMKMVQQQKKCRLEQTTHWMLAVPNALSKHMSRQPRSLLAPSFSMRHFTTSRALHKCISNSELQTGYAYDQSTFLTDDALLRDLREETARNWPKAEQLIDEMQGKFLSFLVQTTKAQRALEIGCFTGYSALCLANGLSADGTLVTCDIDSNTMQFAQSFFDKSSHADQITAVNQEGLEYLKAAALSISTEQQKFDFIFVDANKRKYRAYYDVIIQHNLLHPSGLLVFDNTLFRNRVAVYASGLASSKERIARDLDEFNSYVAQDTRTTQVVLPLWDGLTLIRYSDKRYGKDEL